MLVQKCEASILVCEEHFGETKIRRASIKRREEPGRREEGKRRKREVGEEPRKKSRNWNEFSGNGRLIIVLRVHLY